MPDPTRNTPPQVLAQLAAGERRRGALTDAAHPHPTAPTVAGPAPAAPLPAEAANGPDAIEARLARLEEAVAMLALGGYARLDTVPEEDDPALPAEDPAALGAPAAQAPPAEPPAAAVVTAATDSRPGPDPDPGFLARFLARVPEALLDRLNEDDGFHAWLDTAPEPWGRPRRAELDEAVATGDAERAARLFLAYGRAPTGPQPLISPAAGRGTVAPAAEAPIDRAAIRRLQDDLSRGRLKGAALDAAIRHVGRAVAAGRIL